MHNKSKLTLRFFTIILATLFALTCFPAAEEAFASKRDEKGEKSRFSGSDSKKKERDVKRHDKHEKKIKRGDKKALRGKHIKKAKRGDKKVSRRLDRDGWKFGSPPGSHKKRAAVKRHDSRKKIERRIETKSSLRHKKSGRIYRSRHSELDRHYRRMVFNRHDHHRRVRFRGIDHYYQHGHFYRRGPYGYFLVNAPIGAVVWSLAFGFDTIWIGGSAYYHYGGTYYQRAPAGYVVVAPPASAVAVREPSEGPMGSVYIEAVTLNVRAQPGRSHPVIHQLHEGDIVTVYGTAPGWFYVELPNGYFGWIVRDCQDLQAAYGCG